MSRATLNQARRLYSFSEAMVVTFAQANIPYAALALLLLRLAEFLVSWAPTCLIARPTMSSKH
ncbi:hypothetical protein V5F31_13775 [Xanthobacter sp. V7C-4]|uniref:hypothetical protein n=1 Tax=Xanthobacter autotrophicus (strain ATCC BAA-1158 / Py2) TaxID=78245 RepID=UPI0037273288